PACWWVGANAPPCVSTPRARRLASLASRCAANLKSSESPSCRRIMSDVAGTPSLDRPGSRPGRSMVTRSKPRGSPAGWSRRGPSRSRPSLPVGPSRLSQPAIRWRSGSPSDRPRPSRPPGTPSPRPAPGPAGPSPPRRRRPRPGSPPGPGAGSSQGGNAALDKGLLVLGVVVLAVLRDVPKLTGRLDPLSHLPTLLGFEHLQLALQPRETLFGQEDFLLITHAPRPSFRR